MTLRRLGLTAVSAVALPAALSAQIRPLSPQNQRAPDKNASLIMVTAFKSSDKGTDKSLSVVAAQEMRDKIEDAFSFKQVYVFPRDRIDPNLISSQFPTTEGLEQHDAKALAAMLRADEYIAGTAEKSGAGFKVSADLVLTRDINARQPLGVVEAPKLGDAIKGLVLEMKEARKQLDGEKKCMGASREGKFAEAAEFAKAAIVAYPKATLARACLLGALNSSKAPVAEITKVAKELTAIDSRSNIALQYVANAYRESKDSDSLVVVLVKMMNNDPRNTEFGIAAVEEIAAQKNPGVARPIIEELVKENPGDPDILKLRWKILFAMKDYPEMFKQGDELVRLDTAFADTSYFVRNAQTYALDSNWAKAAAEAAKGVAKFRTNAFLTAYEINMLDKAGQTQQALEKLDAAMAAKIPVPQAGTMKLIMLQKLNSPLVVATARELIAAGDTTSDVRQIILNNYQQRMTDAQKQISTDAAGALDTLNSVVSGLQADAALAANAKQKSHVAFLVGYSSYFVATIKAQQGQATKNCQLLKDAKVAATMAMTNLPQGAGYAPPATINQALGGVIQLDTGLSQMIAPPLCK